MTKLKQIEVKPIAIALRGKPHFIVGLGNPGSQYAFTYHNVGFLFIDYLRQKREDKNFILLKPKTFMNESGKAVAATLKRFKVKPEEILVIHDDSDIELGKFKISFDRGSAGHKGVQSIIDELKTKKFWRLRIGIRKTTGKAEGLVLKKITPADRLILEKVFEEFKI